MPKIEILSGKREGEWVDLTPEGLDIGNRKTAKLSIRDPWISWNHAKISFEDGRYVIEDLGSSNGTVVNGKKLAKDAKVAISPADDVMLGRTKIRIVEGEGGAAPARAGSDSSVRLAREIPAVSSFDPTAPETGDERVAALERERDELRRMKEVLERFLDLTPEERASLAAAPASGRGAADTAVLRSLEAQCSAAEARAADLEAKNAALSAQVAELESRPAVDPGPAVDVAALEKGRQEAVAKQIELEGKVSAAEARAVELEARLRTSAEAAKKDLARAREKLEAELAAAAEARESAVAAQAKAEARAEELAKKVETASADANARAEKLARDLESAKKSAIEAEGRASRLERDLDAARRATGRMSASGQASNPELEQALADLAHARAERDDWQRRHDETRAEIDRISMEQIELEDQLRARIAELEGK